MALSSWAVALVAVASLVACAIAAPAVLHNQDRVREPTLATVTAGTHAAAAIATLQTRYYNAGTGGWGCVPALWRDAHTYDGNGNRTPPADGMSVGWWNCANALTAVSDYVTYAADSGANASVYTDQITSTQPRHGLTGC